MKNLLNLYGGFNSFNIHYKSLFDPFLCRLCFNSIKHAMNRCVLLQCFPLIPSLISMVALFFHRPTIKLV
ncbi:hypothetical protein VNO78_02371 [Psophocarpus tetragonolobus]|uniref:Uncharacterized protein n=1 Tax=Psophocarpus tetragonolobus TaxID=3891 RepID=A0AAN9XV21_PSOTE